MAATLHTINDPTAVKIFSRKLASDTVAATFIGKFIGEGEDSLLQVYGETGKEKGDSVQVTLRGKLTGDGVLGDNTGEGNEEALDTFIDKLVIDQLREIARNGGRMSAQRVQWKFRENAKDALRDWWSERLDVVMFNQLGGNTAQADLRYTGANATLAPTSIIRAGDKATDQALVAADVMTLALIDAAVTAAKTRTRQGRPSPMRPIKVNGQDKWLLFIHPFQGAQLRKDADWKAIANAGLAGGAGTKSPIYTGAMGEYNGVVIHETVYVPHGVDSTTNSVDLDTRRAILCGAQAGAIAFGEDYSLKNFDWFEEKFDYGNQFGVACGLIFGIKKTRYNSLDHSVTVVSTFSSANDA